MDKEINYEVKLPESELDRVSSELIEKYYRPLINAQ